LILPGFALLFFERVFCLDAYNVAMRTSHVSGDDYPHRGVTMHELPVGANLPGLASQSGASWFFSLRFLRFGT